MQLTLKVSLPDNAYEVTTNLFTVVAWERRFKRKASDMATGIGIEDLAYLAWEASKHHKVVVPGDFDAFIKQLVNIEVVEAVEPTPFTQAPTEGN
jgi:hypothetical protein